MKTIRIGLSEAVDIFNSKSYPKTGLYLVESLGLIWVDHQTDEVIFLCNEFIAEQMEAENDYIITPLEVGVMVFAIALILAVALSIWN